VELGREHDVVAATLQRLPDDLLGLAAGVHIGGVDDVDAGVERTVDDPDAVVVVGVALAAEHHGAQGKRTDLDAGGPEVAVGHAVSLA
jgi:hypothetical protein